MKVVVSIEINCPKEKLITLLANPNNNKYWMEDLVEYQPVHGEAGEVGSMSHLVFKNGDQTMSFTSMTKASHTS